MRYRYELAQSQHMKSQADLSHSAIEHTINNALANLRYQSGLGVVNPSASNKLVKNVATSVGSLRSRAPSYSSIVS